MTNPGSSVTMEEIGEQLAAAVDANKATDLGEVRLEGDHIPAELRGKTVTELLRDREVLSQSVQIANAARLAAESAALNRPSAAVEAPAPVDTRMSKEAWEELFQSNPMQAIAYMNEIAIRDAAGQFDRRFAALSNGAATTAESSAKVQFKNEFELFGAEIKQITDGLPDKSILANPEGWSHIISFVRGKPGNFEKLMEVSRSKAAEAAALEARGNQDRSTGASLSTSTVRPGSGAGAPAPEGGNFGLDADERRAADVMGMSHKDYAHWKTIGG